MNIRGKEGVRASTPEAGTPEAAVKKRILSKRKRINFDHAVGLPLVAVGAVPTTIKAIDIYNTVPHVDFGQGNMWNHLTSTVSSAWDAGYGVTDQLIHLPASSLGFGAALLAGGLILRDARRERGNLKKRYLKDTANLTEAVAKQDEYFGQQRYIAGGLNTHGYADVREFQATHEVSSWGIPGILRFTTVRDISTGEIAPVQGTGKDAKNLFAWGPRRRAVQKAVVKVEGEEKPTIERDHIVGKAGGGTDMRLYVLRKDKRVVLTTTGDKGQPTKLDATWVWFPGIFVLPEERPKRRAAIAATRIHEQKFSRRHGRSLNA